MSINYVLYFAGPWSPREAIRELTRGLLAPEGASSSNGRVTETIAFPHLWVVATVPTFPTNRYIEEEHSLLPRLRLQVRLDTENLSQAQDELLELVSRVLIGSREDLVLLREGDNVALLRRGGRLELHDDALWASAERSARAEQWLHEVPPSRGS
ncbi:MAG TPA: SitI3 family protein [Archangium sp.]|nr:SitI3 family protein [Archangium sp.]